jgi:hypothetical protein
VTTPLKSRYAALAGLVRTDGPARMTARAVRRLALSMRSTFGSIYLRDCAGHPDAAGEIQRRAGRGVGVSCLPSGERRKNLVLGGGCAAPTRMYGCGRRGAADLS